MSIQDFTWLSPGDITVGTDAYTANDVVGGLLTFTMPAGVDSGYLIAAKVTDANQASAALTIYIFEEEPTTIADDAQEALVIADLEDKLVGTFTVSAYNSTVGSLDYAFAKPDTVDVIPFTASGAGFFYAYIVDTGGATFTAATDLALRLCLAAQAVG